MGDLQLSDVVLEPASAEDHFDIPVSTSAEVGTSTDAPSSVEVQTSRLRSPVSTSVPGNLSSIAEAATQSSIAEADAQNAPDPPVARPRSRGSEDDVPGNGGLDDLGDLERDVRALDWDEVSSEASDAIHNVVDSIIGRMRVERMFELRRMQMGNRAVTTGSQRQHLEQFFSGEQEGQDVPRQPLNENIREDLDGLTRQRSVSNLLNTRFRRVLENSLAQQPDPSNQIGYRRQPQHGPPPGAPPGPPPGAPHGPPPGAPPVAPPLPRAAIRTNPPAAIPHYTPPSFDNQFDHVIDGVEELFQRRLVSDVLHSTFRNVLELHIERRLIRSGRQPVQRFVPIPQEQFEQQARGQDVILPTSRRLPDLERQVTDMAGELKEVKSMLRLMMDCQLDMQRALRQEVSALIRNSTETPARPTKPVKEGCCVICLEKPADTVLYQCGHLCCCTNCGRMLKAEGHHCPVCRAEVKDILRIFHSAQDD